MNEKVEINKLLETIENESDDIVNDYINLCNNINDLSSNIRCSKSSLADEYLNKIQHSVYESITKLKKGLDIKYYYEFECEKLFNDSCDYARLYLETIKEFNEELCKEYYG